MAKCNHILGLENRDEDGMVIVHQERDWDPLEIETYWFPYCPKCGQQLQKGGNDGIS